MIMKASDFIFGIGTDCMGVAITPKYYFDSNGCMLDRHIDHQIKDFWPEGIEMDEVQEGMFALETELTYDELKDEFVNAGFIHSPDLENLCA
ncbi:hypothetical protein hairong_114 [Pseudomonas phage hairong]|nr:hypothetical protein hairong_114 [Pseudomonas phage hairong]